MLDNIGGGTGRLPNEATRKRRAELIDSLGGAVAVRVPTSVLERYVGEYEFPNYALLVLLKGDTLTSPRLGMPLTETNLVPVDETRFKLGSEEVEPTRPAR